MVVELDDLVVVPLVVVLVVALVVDDVLAMGLFCEKPTRKHS